MYPEPQGLTCNPEDGQLAQEEQLQALKVGPALGVKGQVKAPPPLVAGRTGSTSFLSAGLPAHVTQLPCQPGF